MTLSTRRLLTAACVAIALTIGFFAAYRLALNELRVQVLNALGPDAEIGDIDLSFRAIQISALKLKSPAGWPAKYALSADAITIIPNLTSLFTDTIVISLIKAEHATLVVVRDRGGKMRMMPGLTERKASSSKNAGDGASTAMRILIGEVMLKDSSVSFFDAGARSPPLEIKLDNVNARLSNLRMPGLADKSNINISATIKGPVHQGTLSVDGWMVMANKDSDIKTIVRGADIVSLEPYLIKKAETGVRKGVLDLDLHSKISTERVSAPGVLRLKDLELGSDGGTGTFMGMPRDAVIGMLRERDGGITIPFTIAGNLNDPNFALDSAFKARVGLAAAATLGLTIRDLIDVFGNRKDTSGESDGNAGKVIEALKGLFGKH